jgi:hypothetical protein
MDRRGLVCGVGNRCMDDLGHEDRGSWNVIDLNDANLRMLGETRFEWIVKRQACY